MVVVLLGAAAIGARVIKSALDHTNPIVSECTVMSATTGYVIDQQQAANAATITAVALQLGLPDHAVTIALATAFQESKLHNISYGDRDSVGLFQQRPSQGWGTPAQLLDPRYAAAAFFRALARIPDWRTDSVTDAAQAVQRSSDPQAYARWESMARALAIATTGETAAGLTCQYQSTRLTKPAPSPVPTLDRELGSGSLSGALTTRRGWVVATWLVAHAEPFHITSITFGAQRWTPKGTWRPDTATGPGIQFTQAAPPGA